MSEEPGLLAWIGVLRRRILLLGGFSILCGVLALVVALLLPRWYQARASILPPHEDTRELRTETGIGMALQLDVFRPYTEGVTLADVYLAILGSDTVARSLIDRFDLEARYRTPNKFKTLRSLRSHTVIAPTYEHAIEVKVEDKDPKFAADLANAYIEELNRVFVTSRSSAGKRQREFLELRLAASKADLDSMERALSELQERRGLTSISRNMTEAALAAGNLLGRRLALAVRLGILDDLGAGATPGREELEAELRSVNAEVSKLPVLGLETARHLRDLRMAEILYLELLQQLEVARVEEARDTPAVDVLDTAIPPDRHSRPRRGLTAIAGAVAGFGLALAWTVARQSPA